MPGSSERAFLLSLCDIAAENGRHSVINHQNFKMAFKEWCYWKYEKDKIQGLDWLECPPCTIHQHGSHVDGNCKLYRFKRGNRKQKSYYENSFIDSKEEVDLYMKKLYKKCSGFGKNNDYYCRGNWAAAKNVKRKTRYFQMHLLKTFCLTNKLKEFTLLTCRFN